MSRLRTISGPSESISARSSSWSSAAATRPEAPQGVRSSRRESRRETRPARGRNARTQAAVLPASELDELFAPAATSGVRGLPDSSPSVLRQAVAAELERERELRTISSRETTCPKIWFAGRTGVSSATTQTTGSWSVSSDSATRAQPNGCVCSRSVPGFR